MPTLAELRIEQTHAGNDRLRDDVGGWARLRLGRDTFGQYRTQLVSLQETFAAASQRIATLCAHVPLDEAFERCRAVDEHLALVRRLWQWYADKFDQRDDPSSARLLAAADEVVWSVHAQVHRSAGISPVPPAPLPYLDAVTAPEAIVRDDPPPRLRPGSFDDHLKLLLSRLPVPVVALPDAARAEPWTLVLLGHEVGHHLQYDLRARYGLVAAVRREVTAAAAGPPGTDGSGDEGARWGRWSQELFADLAGLTTMGPASLAALLPYELGSESWLLGDRRDTYPPPVVRIATLVAMGSRLGLDCRRELGGYDPAVWVARRDDDRHPDERDSARADLSRAARVADALVSAVVTADGPAHQCTLADLAMFRAENFRSYGRVEARAEHLLADGGPAEEGLATVRELTSAAMVAWQRLARSAAPDRLDRTAALATTVLDRLIAGREEGTRAAAAGPGDGPDEDVIALLSSVELM
jgi:hypothetical protein